MKKFQSMETLKGVNMDDWITTNYSSLGQLLKHLEKNENTDTNSRASHDGSERFTGTTSFAKALDLLTDGSAEIMKGLKKQVKLAIADLAKELNTLPQGYVADVTGLFFDVSKVIDGEPEAWLREPWNKEKKPRIKIPMLGSYNAGFSKENAIKNASEIIALVKALEDNGFEVEMAMVFLATNAGGGSTPHLSQSVMIKGYDENFNWSKLSAMLHPSFFRRIMFRDEELAYPTNLNGGYGQTADAKKYFVGGETMLNLAKHESIEKFKNQVLYRLKGNK